LVDVEKTFIFMIFHAFYFKKFPKKRRFQNLSPPLSLSLSLLVLDPKREDHKVAYVILRCLNSNALKKKKTISPIFPPTEKGAKCALMSTKQQSERARRSEKANSTLLFPSYFFFIMFVWWKQRNT
jgi:hypothetical protein